MMKAKSISAYFISMAFVGSLLFGCGSRNDPLVIERPPVFCDVTPEVLRYVSTFPDYRKQGGEVRPKVAIPQDILKGEVLWQNQAEDLGLAVLKTLEGKDWEKGQHLYLFRAESGEVKELNTEGVGIVNSQFAMKNEEVVLLLEGPEGAASKTFVWEYNLAMDKMEQITKGHNVVTAPNRRQAAFLRSDTKGFHSIHLLDMIDYSVKDVLSLWEDDPGSGLSFRTSWSEDSEMLFISGWTRGFLKRNSGDVPKEIRLICRIKDLCIFDATSERQP